MKTIHKILFSVACLVPGVFGATSPDTSRALADRENHNYWASYGQAFPGVNVWETLNSQGSLLVADQVDLGGSSIDLRVIRGSSLVLIQAAGRIWTSSLSEINGRPGFVATQTSTGEDASVSGFFDVAKNGELMMQIKLPDQDYIRLEVRRPTFVEPLPVVAAAEVCKCSSANGGVQVTGRCQDADCDNTKKCHRGQEQDGSMWCNWRRGSSGEAFDRRSLRIPPNEPESVQ